MANSTSHALPYPIKGARFSLPIGFRVAAGTPTDPTTPDTEISTDGGATFADCAEEITTGGTNGAGYLTLSGAETNNNILVLAAKSANDVTSLLFLHPRVLASIGTGTLSAGSAGGGTLGTLLAYDVTGCFIRTTGGTGGGGSGGANNQARKIATYNTGTGAFTVVPNWETTPDNTTTYEVHLPEGVTLGMLRTLNPATAGRQIVVDASGLADANAVKLGPTGSGTAQTARDIGASVLLSSGTGTGQVKLASGYVAMTWADIAAPTTTVNLSGTSIGTAAAVTTVNGLASNVITAASIASDAITAAKIADGAIDTATFASGTTIPRVTLADTTTTNTDMRGTDNAATAAALAALVATVGVAGAGLTAADDAVLAAIAALNNLSSAGAASAFTTALTTALAEGYRATGATGSVRDLLYEILAGLLDHSITATTKTSRKIDGTTAKTYTLDSAVTPTSITEAT